MNKYKYLLRNKVTKEEKSGTVEEHVFPGAASRVYSKKGQIPTHHQWDIIGIWRQEGK